MSYSVVIGVFNFLFLAYFKLSFCVYCYYNIFPILVMSTILFCSVPVSTVQSVSLCSCQFLFLGLNSVNLLHLSTSVHFFYFSQLQPLVLVSFSMVAWLSFAPQWSNMCVLALCPVLPKNIICVPLVFFWCEYIEAFLEFLFLSKKFHFT